MAATQSFDRAKVTENGTVVFAKNRVTIRFNVMRIQDARGRDLEVIEGVTGVEPDPVVPRRWQIIAGDRRLTVDKLKGG